MRRWAPHFLDLMPAPAGHGAAWTLLHPEFTVVVPQPDPVKVPTAFGMALAADELANAANEGMVDRAYDVWILGQGAKDTRPRWSIIRDVLGWAE